LKEKESKMVVINGKIMRKKRKRLIKSPDGVLIEDKNQVTEYETDEEYLPIEDRRKRLALKESRVGGQLEKELTRSAGLIESHQCSWICTSSTQGNGMIRKSRLN